MRSIDVVCQQGFMSHEGKIVPRDKFGDRDNYVQDLKKLGVWDKSKHAWLEQEYTF